MDAKSNKPNPFQLKRLGGTIKAIYCANWSVGWADKMRNKTVL